MNITDKQIYRQIIGETRIKITFYEGMTDLISIYKQEGVHWIKPCFLKAKKINQELYKEIINSFTGEQKYCTDPEIIKTEYNYDDWYNKYYNNI